MTTTTSGVLTCTGAMVLVGMSVAFAPALTDYPLLAGQAGRYFLSAAILTGVMARRGLSFPRLRPRQLVHLFLLAGTGLAGFNWLLIEGAERSDPAFAAAVLGATPLVLALAGPWVDGSRVRRRTVLASAVVVVGIVLVQGATAAPLAAVPYAVGLLACEVAFTLLAVPLLRDMSPLQLSGAVCLVSMPLLVALALAEPGADLDVPSAVELTALGFLVLATAVAFLFWYDGVVRLGVDRAGLFAGVMPVAALVAGLTVGTSTWSATALAGSVLCGAGIAAGLR